jgi:hypothetical protein
MQLRVHYSDGTCDEAILLIQIGSRIRVAVPGGDDALEFTKRGEIWLAESGERVKIEFNAKAANDRPVETSVELGVPVWPATPAQERAPLWLN